MTAGDTTTMTSERADLAEALAKHRYFLRHTARGLNDEQAVQRTTVSELTIAGLIKHVTATERQWARFIIEGPSALNAGWEDDDAVASYADGFRMLPGETLDGLLRAYDDTARQTTELIAALPDLDAAQRLPEAPWFEAGASWSARRVLLHILAETSQHAGHADIIREALDGAKSMA